MRDFKPSADSAENVRRFDCKKRPLRRQEGARLLRRQEVRRHLVLWKVRDSIKRLPIGRDIFIKDCDAIAVGRRLRRLQGVDHQDQACPALLVPLQPLHVRK